MSKSNRALPEDEMSGSEDVFSDSDDQDEATQARMNTMFEKDSDEEELEKLVLGNLTGSRQTLFSGGLFDGEGILQSDALEKQIAVQKEDVLEAVDDSMLFAFDTARTTQDPKIVDTDAEAQGNSEEAPAWVDSDDERLTISLAGVTQFRKLRETEADDLVNGVEYTKRLRQQYLRLHPMPLWATTTTKSAKDSQAKKERRRRRSSAAASTAASDSSAASDSDADSNDGDLSDTEALPLERILRSANLINGEDGPRKKRKLRPETLDIQRTRDIPVTHKAPVASISFHPQQPVLLSCSTSSVIYLHTISPTAHPTPNPQLAAVQARSISVRRAEFAYPGGDQIIFSGRRKFFHSWNIATGKVVKVSRIQGHGLEQRSMERFRLSSDGQHMAIIATSRKGGGMLNILRLDSMQWVAQARLDGRGGIADFGWWRDGSGVTILGKDGQVAEWSLAAKRTIGLWRDEGSIGGTVLALGGKGGPSDAGGDRWIALGSSSGVLNIYDRLHVIGKDKEGVVQVEALPEPTRRCEQLTTPITVVTFAPDGQLLAFGSQHKKDALKLVHLPSCTIYRNWPTEQTPLGRITAVAFGKDSDMLAVGNEAGKMRLWDIRA